MIDANTASERLFEALALFWAHMATLGPMELGVDIALSLLIVAAAGVAGRLMRRLLKRAAQVIPGPSDAEKHVRTRRITRFTWTVVEIGLWAAAVCAVCAVWGFDVAAWLSRGLGEQLVHAALRMGVVLVLTFAAVELSGLLIHRLVSGLAHDAVEPRRAGQLNTLAPVLGGVARTVIIVIGAMMLLSQGGVKIGPLLAGAGIVGVAVGFGAQTLVKDFLTGVFLIVEDIVAIGDVVRIGDCGGLVEQMTVRTIRLRDFDGTLHAFPYGEAQVIHNMTKTFSFYVFDLRISYDSDIDRALEIMRLTGAELMADSAFAAAILEPIEIVGVDALGDSAVTLKARIKTLPIKQWTVGREYNRRIKPAFDAAGISIASPRLQVVAPQSRSAAADA